MWQKPPGDSGGLTGGSAGRVEKRGRTRNPLHPFEETGCSLFGSRLSDGGKEQDALLVKECTIIRTVHCINVEVHTDDCVYPAITKSVKRLIYESTGSSLMQR